MDAVSLLIGRAGSRIKNKNVRKILGRQLCLYPMLAFRNSRAGHELYVSTDCPQISEVAASQDAILIDRPAELATNAALAEDAYLHAYEAILKRRGKTPDYIILGFCNGATIRPGIIDEGIDFLEKNPDFDSAVSVSQYNMFSPLRARRIVEGKALPFVDPSIFAGASCDRDSQGDTFYFDCSVFVVRPRCFDYSRGEIPFRWVGRTVHPLQNWGGCDVDHEWQFRLVEFWLREHGFSESVTPYDSLR